MIVWSILALLLGNTTPTADEEPPLLDRPVDVPFSQASAGFARSGEGTLLAPFRVTATATLTEVEALAPLTFTFTVDAMASVRRPPQRLDLREINSFKDQFHIEDVTDGKVEQPRSGVWQWVYHLRPRSEAVTEIPGVPFLYYNPDLRPAAKAYQLIYSDPITLRVGALEGKGPPVDLPASVEFFASGSEVLKRSGSNNQPGAWLVLLALLLPPLGCTVWYFLWRRLYPDAASRTRLRLRRAGQQALRLLERAGKLQGRQQAEGIALALAGYLRDRFDLASAELTPPEAELLTQRGCARELATQASELLADCAAGRFQPGEDSPGPLVEKVTQLILAMEEQTCE